MPISDSSIDSLEKVVENAFLPESVDVVTLKEIIQFIHSIKKDKKNYETLYKSIGEKLFLYGTNLSEYQPNHFSNKAIAPKKTNLIQPEQDDFNNKLKNLISCCQNDFEVLNKCLILKFGDDISKNTDYLLLHDTHSKPHVFAKVNTEYSEECHVFEVSAFIKELESSKIDMDYNYLVLLVLSFNPNPDDTIIKQLSNIKGYLSPISQILLVDDSSKQDFYKTVKDYSIIENEVKYLVSKELKDLNLTKDVEKIIKKLFRDDLSTSLQYKKMSKGFSGSLVLYLRPVGVSHTQVRYVIKVGNTLESISKIETEIKNFRTYVRSYSASYQYEQEQTEKCIAICYKYASKDGKIDAESFSEMYEKVNDLNPVIKMLFDNPLFKEWKETKSIETITFEKHYKSYINRTEIIKAIAQICDKPFEEVEQSTLLKIFTIICEIELDSFKKVCHGDLHSENFLVDEDNNVFLIDFGDTEFRHSLIDYTTLECSIKFKHIPKYIENNELLRIELELLELDSFKQGFVNRNITRSDLRKPYRLISTIRAEAFGSSMIKDKESQLEYLYSLFMITFRQIRYPSMNQIYAIKSAELIGNKILNLIGRPLENKESELSIFL